MGRRAGNTDRLEVDRQSLSACLEYLANCHEPLERAWRILRRANNGWLGTRIEDLQVQLDKVELQLQHELRQTLWEIEDNGQSKRSAEEDEEVDAPKRNTKSGKRRKEPEGTQDGSSAPEQGISPEEVCGPDTQQSDVEVE